MTISSERAENLTKYFTDDKDRARNIFSLPLSDACRIINSDGFDYTEEELRDYAEYIRRSFAGCDKEIGVIELDDVSGGVATEMVLASISSLLSSIEGCKGGWVACDPR